LFAPPNKKERFIDAVNQYHKGVYFREEQELDSDRKECLGIEGETE
jgi:hypothetical protein